LYVTKEECDRYDDSELIVRSLEQVAYFACLYDRYEDRLIRYVQRLGGVTREEAEDILQDGYVKVWKGLATFDPAMPFSSWLFRVLHNETISYLRKQRTSGRVYATEYDEAQHAAIADRRDTDNHAIADEQEINQILDRMALKYKEVLVLKFLENMSYEEISDILKMPEGTVATRINRAKKEFRKHAKELFVLSQ